MSNTVLDQLNTYSGTNVWEDVIHQLGYDEAATDKAFEAAGRNPACSDMAVIDGVTYRFAEARGEWVTA
jgi:hypothetical protein